MSDASTFLDNEAARRFELQVAGETAYADYERAPGCLVIRFVYAPPVLRGTGASDRLMRKVASLARQEGRHIRALCGFADGWLRTHDEGRDLLVTG